MGRIDDVTVDTGTAFTWIGHGKEYVITETSAKQENEVFNIRYAKGSAAGAIYKDHITLSPSLKIPAMLIGVASSSNAPLGSEGTLGLGRALGGLIIRLKNGQPVPTVMDALLQHKQIQRNIFGVSFAPVTSQGVINGRLTFGGTSVQKYKYNLHWVKATEKAPCNIYWGIEQTIKYGDKILQPSSAGVVDTGSSLIHITPQAFDKYRESIPGSKIGTNGLLEIPENSVGHMKTLSFIINGKPYDLPPKAQLWPQELNTNVLRGRADAHYSVVGWLPEELSKMGIGFVSGYAFLQRFYTAYDASESMIGFAVPAEADVN
ncbi:unnamed protein product [Rhizoctonia solani]|uniref:Peptidase A1 domain-containing protein n=1 Tax=Rhizoctonia solani TaxID=456999 RepID=A0A8H3HKM9_9AGAM|nr:unnamed protein product [Rhizoctonia solani]